MQARPLAYILLKLAIVIIVIAGCMQLKPYVLCAASRKIQTRMTVATWLQVISEMAQTVIEQVCLITSALLFKDFEIFQSLKEN